MLSLDERIEIINMNSNPKVYFYINKYNQWTFKAPKYLSGITLNKIIHDWGYDYISHQLDYLTEGCDSYKCIKQIELIKEELKNKGFFS